MESVDRRVGFRVQGLRAGVWRIGVRGLGV